MAKPIGKFIITPHALFEMVRRDISVEIVERVLSAPEQREAVRPGRDILQSRMIFGNKTYLIRVFVDVEHDPVMVVTVYRTSKMEKYWRKE